MVKYKAREGSIFNDEQANIYGKCVEKIEQEKGSVKPLDVVEEGEKTESPLHEYFDWDDKSAADKHRLQQARYLLNHLIVEITIEGKSKDQNAFFSVDIDIEGGNKGYLSLGKALSIPIYREQVLDVALRELQYWQDKYKDLKELSLIFIAIRKMRQKINKKKGKP